MRNYIIILLALLPLCINAQEKKPRQRTIALWGHVFDSFTRHGLPAKMTLMLRDSTVVDTTTAWRADDAPYRFDVPAKNEHYIIRAVYEGYDTCYVDYYVHNIVRNDYFDAPWHYMKRVKREERRVKNQIPNAQIDSPLSTLHSSLTLDEVVVTGTKIRMVQRGDTIIYDASAFNLPDGSMLDALVRQLPGAELKSNGDIYVNGRKIDYLTLNGTDFFKGKNKVMLDNLPYYVVRNVKVYNKSSERSRLLGREVEKKDYVMDVNQKKEYSTGLLGNIEGGKGSEDRYLARLFSLLFTDKSRYSTYGNINNVNEDRAPGGEGDWEPSNMPQGVKTTKEAGFDFSHSNNEKLSENLNTGVVWADHDDETKTHSENNVAGNNVIGDSHSDNRNKEFQFWANNNFSYRQLVNNPFSFRMNTELRLYNNKTYSSQSDSTMQNSSLSYDDSTRPATANDYQRPTSASLTNRSWNSGYSHRHGLTFHNLMEFDKKLPWGDHIGLTSTFDYSRSKPSDNYISYDANLPHYVNLYAMYEMDTDVPDFASLMPYENNINPLSRTINNPNLKNSHSHRLFSHISIGDSIGNSWNIDIAGALVNDYWGHRTTYNPYTGAYTTMQDNVDDMMWYQMLEIGRNQWLDKARRLSLYATLSESCNRNVDHTYVQPTRLFRLGDEHR